MSGEVERGASEHVGLEPCPKGNTDYEACFAPFRYCPEKGCGRAEGKPDRGALLLDRNAQVGNLLDIARKRAAAAQEQRLPLEPATWTIPHRHYREVDTCEHGERLHVGWLEMAQEAEHAQQVLDFLGIPDGLPQGAGDVDYRTAVAAVELMDARERLSRIAQNHCQERGEGGTVGSYCVECSHLWPCPSYRFANGDADPLDSWIEGE